MKPVVLVDSNPTPIWAGETFDLDSRHGAKDILRPIYRVQETNLAFITLVIKIAVHR